MIESPQENRAVVEVTENQSIGYRACDETPVTRQNLGACTKLGEDLPNTDRVRQTLESTFTNDLTEQIKWGEIGAANSRVLIRAVVAGMIFTGLEGAYRAFRGVNLRTISRARVFKVAGDLDRL